MHMHFMVNKKNHLSHQLHKSFASVDCVDVHEEKVTREKMFAHWFIWGHNPCAVNLSHVLNCSSMKMISHYFLNVRIYGLLQRYKVKSPHKMTQEYVSHLGQGPWQYESSGKCKRNLVGRGWSAEGKRGAEVVPPAPQLSGGGSTAPRPCPPSRPQTPDTATNTPKHPGWNAGGTRARAWGSAFQFGFAPFTQIKSSIGNCH